jgi:hypothetical protein
MASRHQANLMNLCEFALARNGIARAQVASLNLLSYAA